MVLGFPYKKKPRTKERWWWWCWGGCRQDHNCMFHLGFRSAAITIAALESQISFHVRGPKARGGAERGKAERSDSHAEMAESNLC